MQTIEPTRIAFDGEVPGDKSITHRAILLGCLVEGETVVENPLLSADTEATIRLVEALGCGVERQPHRLVIHGPAAGPRTLSVDCANSGTTARLGIGLVAGLAETGVIATFTGDDSLSRRPMARVTEPLRAAGVEVVDCQGRLPVTVRGGAFTGGAFTLRVASAQVKSALLLAGVASRRAVRVLEPSRSRDHTERMLRLMGHLVVERENGGHEVELLPRTGAAGTRFRVPGDPSSAAFFWALGALPGNRASVRGVSLNPTRIGVLQVLERMGARVERLVTGEASGDPVGDVVVEGAPALRPFIIRAEEVPHLIDEIPVLAVVAMFAEGESRVEGAAELRVKETDRIEVLAEELRRAGAVIETRPDGFVLVGGGSYRPASFSAHGDHRLAMALAVLATRLPGPSTIADDASVQVSFPNFWELLRASRTS